MRFSSARSHKDTTIRLLIINASGDAFRLVLSTMVLILCITEGQVALIALSGTFTAFLAIWVCVRLVDPGVFIRMPKVDFVTAVSDSFGEAVLVVLTGNVNSVFVIAFFITQSVMSTNLAIPMGQVFLVAGVAQYVAFNALVLAGVLPAVNYIGVPPR